MAKRLNRLLAAIAAAATLATGVAGSAWADTADGKVSFDIKAADGTTLDGMDIGLYKVGDWSMDALERDTDGTLTGVHAVSADTDDRAGFQVAEDGTRTAITPHGKASKAAESAGITLDGSADPLDAAWALGASDPRVGAFARAYARELEDAKAKADAKARGAGSVRLDPGVYVAVCGTDADTAVLAGTATADGGVVRGRGMGAATLTGAAVRSDDAKGISGLLGRAKRGILSLFGLDDGVAVQDVGGSAGVNGYGGGSGSGMEWRWWFQDTKNRDGNAVNVAMNWGGWARNVTNSYYNKDSWTGTRDEFNSVCDSARQNAVNRYGHDKSYYRIVAVGTFLGNIAYSNGVVVGKAPYHGSPGSGALRNAFWSAYNAGGKNEMQADSSDRNGYLSYVGALADDATRGNARMACVVLGHDQPVYHFGLNLTTQAQSTDGYDASQNKWNYVDGGYDGSKNANYGGIEHDTRWVRDRIDVTATENDADFSNVVIETHLRVDEDGDHKVDHEQVITEHWGSGNGTVQIKKGQTVPFWTKPFNSSGLSNWGKPYWPKGHLWFDTWIKCAPGKTCGLGDKQYYHYGDGNNKEEWYRTPTTLKLDTKAEAESDAPTAGGTQRVRDQVTVTPRDDWWLPDDRGASEKGDYKGPILKSWLHYASEDGKTVKDSKMKTVTITDEALQRGGQGWAIDSSHTLYTPWYTPDDLDMTSWQPGTYWFDAAVDVLNEANSPLLAKTYWDHVGKDDADEQFKVSLGSAGLSVSTKASANGASANNRNPVSDSVTLSNTGGTDVKVAKATVTLNYPGYSGVRTASKTITNVTVAAGKSQTVSSPTFTPSDLGFTGNWHQNLKASDRYWFDVRIDPADVTDAAGNKVALTSTPSHDGKADANEQFFVGIQDNFASTKAAGTFARPGGTTAVHDDITLAFDEVPTLNVTSTLNWAADANATKADATKSKTATLNARATTAGPSFTPSDLGMTAWKAGKYWYDLVIPAQTGCPSGKAINGINVAAERWTVSQPTAGLTTKTDAPAGLTDLSTTAVHDTVTASTTGYPANSTFNVTLTLNHRAADGTTSKARAVTFKAAVNGSTKSPDIAPSAFSGWTKWRVGHYWFDLTAVDPNGKTITVSGASDPNEQFDVTEHKSNGFTTKTDAPGNLTDQSATAVHDTVTATTTGYAAGTSFDATLTLNHAASAGASADASRSLALKVNANGSVKSPDFTPTLFGWKTWKAGRYWFDLKVTVDGKAVTVAGANDPNERFDVAVHKSNGFTTKTDAPGNLTDQSATAVHDTVTASTTGYPAGTTFAATLTLNHAASAKAAADASKSLALKVNANGATKSGDFTPALFGWKTWRVGHYWFDLVVTVDGKAVSVPGANDANEQFDVVNHTTKATLAITTQASKGTASTANADPVHDTVRLASTGAALNVARVHVRLNYPKADGTTATAVKDTGAVKVPANGAASVDSPAFTPADLGMGSLWTANANASDHYWFDVWVDKADATLSGDTGVLQLGGSLGHEGKADAAEQFRLDKQSGKATTTAAGTFARAGGTAATHDVLHLAFPGAKTLKATSTLHYAASDTAVKADASKAKTATVAANGDVAGPAFTPADFGWSAWRAGRYWYDLDIPAQSGYDALRVDGLTDKAEQWTTDTTFGLDLAKLAYLGQPGQGRWSNEPVKGATFTLTETTDQTGSTAKPGTAPKTVTTDANGSAHLLDGTIGATGTRWFKLAETKAPASYAKPSAGTYWMVKVAGGADKAAVTVTGSNAEAKALLKGMNGATVTVGNRLEGNIMPPMTGGRYDVARAGALAGLVTLGLLAAGVAALRRRDSDPNR